MINEARRLFEARRYDEAERALGQAADQLGRRAELVSMMGVCRHLKGDADGAVALLREAVELDADQPESWFQLGRVLFEQDRPHESREALLRCVDLAPNHARARVALGQIALAEGRTDAALDALRTALRADPDNVVAMSLLARLLTVDGKLEQAHELAARAVQLDPDDAGAQLAMAQVFRARRHLDFAERCLRNALVQRPGDAEILVELVGVLQQGGRDGEALALVAGLSEALRQRPDIVISEVRSLHRTGRLGPARARLEELGQRAELPPQARALLAELRLAGGDISGALVLAAELAPDRPDHARLIEALAAERQAAHDEALALAEALLDSEDRHVNRQARLLLGRIALRGTAHAPGLNALRPLVDADPGDWAACWILADLYQRADDPAAAAEVLKRWLQSDNRSDRVTRQRVRNRLGDLLDRLGQYEAAAECLVDCGWRPAPLVHQPQRIASHDLARAWMEITAWPWPAEPVGDGRGAPLFVVGWPAGGREAVLDILAAHPGTALLPAADVDRRLQVLGAAADPEALAALDETALRLGRKRYLRAAPGPDRKRVEPAWLQAADLAVLARLFPQAAVIIVQAGADDLELAWRLAGFDNIEQMRRAQERDSALLAHLAGLLPLDWEWIERAELVKAPGNVAQRLAARFDLGPVDGLTERLGPAVAAMRPDGHWRHYAGLLPAGDA